tara:strand:- start:2462 stop:3181 length:720 start_codon:yes stop_codon:yes gene_type:complete
VAKELTHRAGELKSLAWPQEDIARYIELWEYRQRWGAINLEREDRQFLRKAESVLPEISKPKTSVKKLLKDKSYYRWLLFYLEEMNKAEKKFDMENGGRGLWAIILEEELRALDYYEPVLGLPDTLKAKLLKPMREEMVKKLSDKFQVQLFKFEFIKLLESLKDDYAKSWKPLRDDDSLENRDYPVIDQDSIILSRGLIREQILPTIRNNFPSLSETDKPSPPDEWSPKSISVAKKEDS